VLNGGGLRFRRKWLWPISQWYWGKPQ